MQEEGCGVDCSSYTELMLAESLGFSGKEIMFSNGMEKMGPVLTQLYDTLTGIQMGRIEAPEGWIRVIK